MPLGAGAKDTRGVWRYGEADERPLTSDLFNIGMESVSDAMKFFSGTPADRALLTPVPEGAIWQDTDTNRYLWYGEAGVWVRFATQVGTWQRRRSLNGQAKYTLDVNVWTPPNDFGPCGGSNWRQQRIVIARPTDRTNWPPMSEVFVGPDFSNTNINSEVIAGRLRLAALNAATAELIFHNPSAQTVAKAGTALRAIVTLTY